MLGVDGCGCLRALGGPANLPANSTNREQSEMLWLKCRASAPNQSASRKSLGSRCDSSAVRSSTDGAYCLDTVACGTRISRRRSIRGPLAFAYGAQVLVEPDQCLEGDGIHGHGVTRGIDDMLLVRCRCAEQLEERKL